MKLLNRLKFTAISAAVCACISCTAAADGNTPITREKTAAMLYGLAEELNVSMELPAEQPFSDTDSREVSALYNAGILNGVSDTEFAPTEPLSREQMCTMLVRLIGKANTEVDITVHPRYMYDDNSFVSYWAKSAVDFLYYHKIIEGTAENTISPLENLTKEQAEALCDRVAEHRADFVLKTETPDFSWAIEPKFDGLVPNTRFACGLAAVKKNGKYGYIDKDGNTAIPFEYDRCYDFYDGVAKVEKNGKIGYIDKLGKTVAPIEYEDGGNAFENRIWVKKNGKIGFIDKYGNEKIPFIYDYAYDFEEGLASVKKDGLYGFVDYDGNAVIPFKFKWASGFSEGFARVGENGRYSYIDKSGELAIDCKLQWIYDFSEGRAVVYDVEKWGVINTKGEYVKKLGEAGWMSAASEGYIRLHPNDDYERRYGFYNLDFKYPQLIDVDKPVLNPHDANSFHEGLAAIGYHVNEQDTWLRCYINKKAECVFPKREAMNEFGDFDRDTFFLMDFSEGMAAVVNDRGMLGFVKNPLF